MNPEKFVQLLKRLLKEGATHSFEKDNLLQSARNWAAEAAQHLESDKYVLRRRLFERQAAGAPENNTAEGTYSLSLHDAVSRAEDQVSKSSVARAQMSALNVLVSALCIDEPIDLPYGSSSFAARTLIERQLRAKAAKVLAAIAQAHKTADGSEWNLAPAAEEIFALAKEKFGPLTEQASDMGRSA